jgi:hypothetical protein
MRLKYKVNIARLKIQIFCIGFLLTIIGLISPLLFKLFLPPSKIFMSLPFLFFAALLGVITAKFAHETYRFIIARFFLVRLYFVLLPFPKTYIVDGLRKWQAVTIALAPFFDLTILGLIIVIIGKWIVMSFVVTFITVNFVLSARDLVETYYLLSMVNSEEIVQKTTHGFEIWK